MNGGSRRVQVDLGRGRSVVLLPPADEHALLERAVLEDARGEPDGGAPYFAVLWASAGPLARWLLDDPSAPRAGPVLELGCGLGLVGLALAKHAGAEVVLSDAHRDAVANARAAVLENAPFASTPRVERLSWSRPREAALGDPFALVIASDCLYDARAFPALAGCARAWLAPGGRFVTSEPGRSVARGVEAAFALEGLELWSRVVVERGVAIAVWRIAAGADAARQ